MTFREGQRESVFEREMGRERVLRPFTGTDREKLSWRETVRQKRGKR